MRLIRWSKEARGHRQRGDTLVEVTIAFAVLGLVLGATSAIINRSLLSIMNSIERTTARGEVNSQVELLRYVFERNTTDSATKGAFETIKSSVNGNAKDDGCKSSDKAFYLSVNGNKIKVSPVVGRDGTHDGDMSKSAEYAPHANTGGIWVDGVSGSSGGTNYIDFYVRACWTPYSSRTIGEGRLESIVRVTLPR